MTNKRKPCFCVDCGFQLEEVHREIRGVENVFVSDTFLYYKDHNCIQPGSMDDIKNILEKQLPNELNNFLKERGSIIELESQMIYSDNEEQPTSVDITPFLMTNEEAEKCIDHDSIFMISTVRKTEKYILEKFIKKLK